MSSKTKVRNFETASTIEKSTIEAERYELLEAPRYRFTLTRRALFRALGAGLLVLALAPETEAQESGRGGGGRARGGGGPSDVGAWLHFSENGTVSAYTGKAEVGQNIRTSLTQAVAEELRIPVASVTLVMADTDVTPYDMGTFGSRTTPCSRRRARGAPRPGRGRVAGRAVHPVRVERQDPPRSQSSGDDVRTAGEGPEANS